ncbi:hypothetical protein LP417_35675 (plasmid) [Polaromonas sp. P1-6]|nr:hypothetical protein LP417_35675 [Polaromonas sp. P1-6]
MNHETNHPASATVLGIDAIAPAHGHKCSPSQPNFEIPEYEALDDAGFPYLRPARLIDELPISQRAAALELATEKMSQLLGIPANRTIPFGAPVYVAFMSRPEAKKHSQSVHLLRLGESIPLTFCVPNSTLEPSRMPLS